MTTSILTDAFGHHIWANQLILDACAALTPEQLATPVPGTYGSIETTLRHLIQADSFEPPRTRVVPLTELRDALPPETRYVDAETRRRELAVALRVSIVRRSQLGDGEGVVRPDRRSLALAPVVHP